MFTVLSNTRNANLYIITALAIMIVVLLTFAVVPFISVNEPAAIPETSSQNAYAEFLSGEKILYGHPARLSEALEEYHLGEKAMYTNAVDASGAISSYLAGEKTIYTNSVDVSDALSAWSAGEKAIVRPADVEAALWDYRMGEKGLK
jgi:hypothetical protein